MEHYDEVHADRYDNVGVRTMGSRWGKKCLLICCSQFGFYVGNLPKTFRQLVKGGLVVATDEPEGKGGIQFLRARI